MLKLHSLNREIREKTGSIHSDVRFLSYRDKIAREQEEFSTYQSGESKTEEEIIAGFLKTVEQLASEANINLVKVHPSDVVAKKGYVQYFADLECNGRLADMIVFMHKVNAAKNLSKIVKFNMTGKRSSAEDVTVSMRVSKLIIDMKSLGDYHLPGEEEYEMPQEPAFASSGDSKDTPDEDEEIKAGSIWERKMRKWTAGGGGKKK